MGTYIDIAPTDATRHDEKGVAGDLSDGRSEHEKVAEEAECGLTIVSLKISRWESRLMALFRVCDWPYAKPNAGNVRRCHIKSRSARGGSILSQKAGDRNVTRVRGLLLLLLFL